MHWVETVNIDIIQTAKNDIAPVKNSHWVTIQDLSKTPTGAATTSQNNYIQIHYTILSQENLKQLSAEQLNQIENIIKKDEMRQLE